MLYVYAITEPIDAIPMRVGIEGAPVRVVAGAGLMAVVTDCKGPDIVAADDALWLHESVVEQLMSEAAVLPLRFGSTLVADDEAARQMLRDGRDEYVAALQRVRDAVEVSVRVTWPSGVDPDDPSGTAHLINRLERTRSAMALGEEMDAALSEMARASTRQFATSPAIALTSAYLVDRDRLDEFRERVDRLGGELERATVVCTGPWPPYSFADGR